MQNSWEVCLVLFFGNIFGSSENCYVRSSIFNFLISNLSILRRLLIIPGIPFVSHEINFLNRRFVTSIVVVALYKKKEWTLLQNWRPALEKKKGYGNWIRFFSFFVLPPRTSVTWKHLSPLKYSQGTPLTCVTLLEFKRVQVQSIINLEFFLSGTVYEMGRRMFEHVFTENPQYLAFIDLKNEVNWWNHINFKIHVQVTSKYN